MRKEEKKDYLVKAENHLMVAAMHKVTSIVLVLCTLIFGSIAITSLDKNQSYIVLSYIPLIAMTTSIVIRCFKKFDPKQVKLYAEYLRKLDEHNNEIQEIRAEGEG